MDEELLIELLNDMYPDWRSRYHNAEEAACDLDIELDMYLLGDDDDYGELDFND